MATLSCQAPRDKAVGAKQRSSIDLGWRRRETDPSPSLALLKHRHCMPSRRTCWLPASATSSWITYYSVSMAYLQRKLNNISQCLEKKLKFRSHVSAVVAQALVLKSARVNFRLIQEKLYQTGHEVVSLVFKQHKTTFILYIYTTNYTIDFFINLLTFFTCSVFQLLVVLHVYRWDLWAF